MITTLKGSFENPRKYIISSKWMGENEEMASDSQIRTFKNLLFQRCDESERERWLANISDMTKIDIEDATFNLLKMDW